MKGLICSLVLVLCSFFLRAQTTTLAYPIKQGIANSPTTEGVTNAMYGKFIIYSYADTTSANADSYIKHQAFSFISTTSPIALWYRDLTNQIWLQLSVSGSPTVSSWLTRGNDLSGQSLPNRLGTKNGDELNIITSDLIRAIIPAGGIVRSSSAQNKYLMQDTVGKELYYGDGGTTHTWQQTLTAGSTLTGNNTVDVDGYTLTFNSANTFQVNATNEIQFLYNGTTTVELDLASDQFGLVSSVGSISSSISMPASSINLFPYNGAFFIDTLLNSTTQNSLMGWTTTSGANRGKVGYITLGTGGSISSGVLSFTGTQTWQETLTAGSVLSSDVTATIDPGHVFSLAGSNGDIGFDMTTGGVTPSVHIQSGEIDLTTVVSGETRSEIVIPYDNIAIKPYNGGLLIDTLLNLTTQNSVMGWTTTSGIDRGKVGYLTLGTGLTLSSGVLNTSGTVATPISSLTAATATNTANHANYAQEHQWNTLAGITGFKFSSNSTAAASNAQKLVEIDLSGVNATSNQQTYAMYISNTHTGSVSQNRGVAINTSGGSANNTGLEINVSGSATSTYGIAVGGTSTGSSSWGVRSILSGASPANYAGYFSSTNGGSNYALYVNDGNVNLQPLTASQFVSLDASKNMTSSAVASSILAASLTDEVGTDKVVFNTSPSFVTSVIGGASFDAFNTVSTTLNIGGAATTMTIGGTPTTAITHNYSTNATATATTKTINFGTGGAAGSTTNVNVGDADGGTTTVNSPTLAAKIITGTSSANVATFTSTGYAQNTIQVTDPDGSMYITNSQIKALNQPFVLNANASYISLQTAGVERMRVAYDGNVGMGVTPTSQLHTTSFGAGYHFVDNADYTVLESDYVISVTSKGGGGGAGSRGGVFSSPFGPSRTSSTSGTAASISRSSSLSIHGLTSFVGCANCFQHLALFIVQFLLVDCKVIGKPIGNRSALRIVPLWPGFVFRVSDAVRARLHHFPGMARSAFFSNAEKVIFGGRNIVGQSIIALILPLANAVVTKQPLDKFAYRLRAILDQLELLMFRVLFGFHSRSFQLFNPKFDTYVSYHRCKRLSTTYSDVKGLCT